MERRENMRTPGGASGRSLPLLAALAVAALLLTGLVAHGTYALFSDTESSADNTFTSGTLDLEVNGENPWMASIDAPWDGLTFAPGVMREAEPVQLHNVGTLPFDLWVRLTEVSTAGGVTVYPAENPVASSEAEYVAEGGPDNWQPDDAIDTDIHMWLYVIGQPVQIPEHTYYVSQLEDMYVYLGEIPAAGTWTLEQFYEMHGTTGNWAQGDTMQFRVELYAQQAGAPLPGGFVELPGFGRP
jgi:predicted ribosomally synthesized peptide with SipW-like signal peptide